VHFDQSDHVGVSVEIPTASFQRPDLFQEAGLSYENWCEESTDRGFKGEPRQRLSVTGNMD
jgi:hypothetical protein